MDKFAFAGDSLVNLGRLLAAVLSPEEGGGGRTHYVLLFDNGQRIPVPELVAKELSEGLKAEARRQTRPDASGAG